jgi:hypothetical protein
MRIFGLIMIILMVFAGIASAQELWFYFDFESDEIDLDILAELLGYEDPGFNAELPDLAVVGVPEVVPGAVGNAWRFDGMTQINLDGSHPGCISSHTSNAAIGGAQGAPYLAIANSATFFVSMIDDFRVYKDYAFSAGEIRSFLSLAVDYQSKVTRTWGDIKR